MWLKATKRALQQHRIISLSCARRRKAMSDGWQLGDMALCIKQGRWQDRETGELVNFGPKAGQILTVSGFARSWLPERPGHFLLKFRGHGHDFFAADRFVKIDPDKARQEEAAEAVDIPVAPQKQRTRAQV
jgi:hypothetical protein